MTDEIDAAIDQVLGSDLDNIGADDLLERLDNELQHQVGQRAMVLGDEDTPPAWVALGQQARGFATMARSFLGHIHTALRQELCESQQGLKDQYRQQLESQSTRDQVKALVPTVVTTVQADQSLVNPLSIGTVVAMWILKIGLEQWCASEAPPPEKATVLPAESVPAGPPSTQQPAATQAPATSTMAPIVPPTVGSGAEPMPVDPSVSTGEADGMPT